MSDNSKYYVPWRDRPFVPLLLAAELLGLSPAMLYRFETEGKLVFRSLGGRTLVDVNSLVTMIDSAEDWAPSTRGAAARAARSRRALENRVAEDAVQKSAS